MLLRGFFHAVLCLAGFALVSTAIRRITPWPNEYGQRAKYEYFAEHKDEFDTIFVGSSVTSYGIVPPVFDQLMESRGHPTHSFNLGVGGMTSLEADHLLRRVLDLEPEHLRSVFVEAENWDARIWSPKNTYAPRMVHWHTIEHTRLAIESLLHRQAPPPEPAEGVVWRVLDWVPPLGRALRARREAHWDEWWRFHESWTHISLCMRKLSGAGQGPRIFAALFDLDRDEMVPPTRAELDELRGYIDLDRIQGEEWEKRREDFLSKLDAYRERVARIDEQNARPADVKSHYNLAGLREQVEAIRERGAEPIYFTGPRLLEAPLELALARAGILPTFLAFNKPGTYPDLYAVENRFDQNHVKRKAAEEFTRLLAESFADHVEAGH
jgi:hypothetical protein